MAGFAPSISPRDQHLSEVTGRLLAQNDNIAVIRIVEAWSNQGAVPSPARLAQARAFFNLRLMDRAGMRAQELVDAEPQNFDALRLLAEIYLERGWPLRARKPLATLRDQGVDVTELWQRAHQPSVRPEAQAREVEQEGDPGRLLALAESFLATGSFLRASGILERLRRLTPDQPRVKELLWGLAGDFGAGEQDLDALVRELAPQQASAPVVTAPRQEDEPEHTESLRVGIRPPDSGETSGDSDSFPALFKHVGRAFSSRNGNEGSRGDSPRDEDTQASPVFHPDEDDQDEFLRERTDPGLPSANRRSDDTQIMLVLRPGEEVRTAHRRKNEDRLRETLNLREWQASMGMSPPGMSSVGPDANDAERMEAEDENIVMMTRPEPVPEPEPEPSEFRHKPIEVIEKHPEPPPAPPLEDLPTEPPESAPPPQLRRIGVLIALLALGMVFLLLAGSLLLSQVRSVGQVDPALRQEVVGALAVEDMAALLKQEGELEIHLRNTDHPAFRAALAEIQLAIWSTYDGAPHRLKAVQELLTAPAGVDPGRVVLLQSAEALARGDIASAQKALEGRQPTDDEERLLFAQIQALTGDLDGALMVFSLLPPTPHYQLTRARLLQDAGRTREAQDVLNAVLSASPNHLLARIYAVEWLDAPPADRLAAADAALSPPPPPRLLARLQLVRARALLALNQEKDALDAVHKGLAHDGTNAGLVYLRAAERMAEGALLDTLLDLENASGAGLALAEAAKVLVLLDVDRVEQAESLVQSLEERLILPERTPVLRALVQVVGRGEAPTDLTLNQDDPLSAYTMAWLAWYGRHPDAPARIEQALTLLEQSRDPFETRLRPRLQMLAAMLAANGEAQARAVVQAHPTDGTVHLLSGIYYETLGQRSRAAPHFDRAPEVCGECGRAWYEKGRFYQDANDDGTRTREAWTRYLGLSPSGPRAERASAWVRQILP